MTAPPYPRLIDPADSFDRLLGWFHDDIILSRSCPGILMGLSGTDSLVAFMAAYRAFEVEGKPNRVMGVHFAPSEDFLYDHPEAEQHLWFSREVIPWVEKQCPEATVLIDRSIDWRYEGLRTGLLADMAAVTVDSKGQRTMRPSGEKYWVSGTRNRSEDLLYRYSNVSLMASLQPLVHLWKSEILQISEYLKVPPLAVQKSCEVDCICGRERLPAEHVQELDWMLMAREEELSVDYIAAHIPLGLRELLSRYIEDRERASFKKEIPYCPAASTAAVDRTVQAFEDGTLDLRHFDHRQHLYVAWIYLKNRPFDESVDRYCHYLHALLVGAGQGRRFSRPITEQYFHKLNSAMLLYPEVSFNDLIGEIK